MKLPPRGRSGRADDDLPFATSAPLEMTKSDALQAPERHG